MVRKKVRDPSTEHQIQCVCFQWCEIKAKSDDRYLMIYAIPNGGRRRLRDAANLKGEGVRRGIWDMNVDVPARGFNGLRVEFKVEKGKLSPEQVEREKLYRKFNYYTRVVRNFNEFKSLIEAYFGEI